jgi:16S rRNA (cytidine1402-2'-O)-methyltransferase
MKQHSTENKTERPDLPSGLYLVATPIGNLRDISFRALDVLRGADIILCEDTRVTRKLLNAYSIETRTQSYHDHSENDMRDKVLGWLQDGKRLALVSDAGMPLISDPGYKLVKTCQQNNIDVTTVPGANAPLAALQLSGMPSDKFCFLGFLPNKSKARQDLLREWISVPATLVAFETAPRIEDALEDIVSVMGPRDVAVVREITKMFEEVRRGSAAELAGYYKENGQPKGELVVVIAPPQKSSYSKEEIEALLRTALKTMKTKEASAFVSEQTGISKSELYSLALEVTKK